LSLNPDFQRYEEMRRVIELYQRASELPDRVDPVVAWRGQTVKPVASETSPVKGPLPNPEMVLSRPATDPDRPPSRRRGGWTKGNSKSSRLRDAAVALLREIGRPASGGEISRAILAKGIEVGGKKPQAYVASQLTGSNLFYHTDEGYGLTEWLNGSTVLPNGRE
jgi:hypothetical protein